MANIVEEQIVRSALWAAYGDAVGFPTELISAQEFSKRNHSKFISGPIDWTRRVGGLFGPEVPFPVGTYSDDTQLRLSTSRAIRGDGYFDVESFAKIELPVWLNYALGAGRGSKAAAANLSLRESTWSQNFYSVAGNHYWNGGGNGAAMRIQPHVWQGHCAGPQQFIREVVRNSICTHGHPRAIIGAAIHSLLLYHTLVTGKVVPPSEWSDIGETAAVQAYESLMEDAELALVWVPNWENLSKRSIKEVWANTVLEWHDCVEVAQKNCLKIDQPREVYHAILSELGGFSAEERGSGLKTVLFASVLVWLFKDEAPEVGILVSANAFKSDTDTIATMAGALVGAIADLPPGCEIQDSEYIQDEARRLFRIGAGDKQSSYRYPNLLTWIAPKNQSDAWVEREGEPHLSGLGRLSLLGEPFASKKGNELLWQWCALPFGQTVLAKRRGRVSTLSVEAESISVSKMVKDILPPPPNVKYSERFFKEETQLSQERSIDEHTNLCIRSGFDSKTIGDSLLSLAQGATGVEKVIAFAAIIAKARLARNNR